MAGENHAEILVINGHDYSEYIVRKGVAWKRNDLDSEDTGRTLDGVMHRSVIDTKRTLVYTLLEMKQDDAAQLDTDLSDATFEATYRDLHGTMTKEFYCSAFSCTLDSVYTTSNEDSYWADCTFTLIEV